MEWIFFPHNFFFFRVLFTKLGSDEIDDVPVFTESNSSFCVDITSTKDGKFITVNSNSRTSSEEGIYLVHFAFLSYDIFISVSDMLRLTSYSVFYRFM
jgi:protease II